MGNLLKLISSPHCFEQNSFSDDIFIDFDNVDPKESEREVYNQISPVLSEGQVILQELREYEGAQQDIKLSIQNPNDPDIKRKAWEKLLPLVCKMKKFWNFSSSFSSSYILLIKELTSDDSMDATKQLETKQALARQLADLLHFTLKFDKQKMENAQLQNDYSFYRRLSQTMSQTSVVQLSENDTLDQRAANDISFFYAKPTPMLSLLSEESVKLFETQTSDAKAKTITVLATFANITKCMLDKQEFRSKICHDTQILCEQVMTAAIILYDHVNPTGAFDKKSQIDVKGAIKLLQEGQTNDAMLNALRYTTRTINHESTQKSIKTLLEVK